MSDGEYGNCDIIGDTQDLEYEWGENRPFDCPLVEAIPKDQYENRLKADMVAILDKIRAEIVELQKDYHEYGWAYDDVLNIIDKYKESEGK